MSSQEKHDQECQESLALYNGIQVSACRLMILQGKAKTMEEALMLWIRSGMAEVFRTLLTADLTQVVLTGQRLLYEQATGKKLDFKK